MENTNHENHYCKQIQMGIFVSGLLRAYNTGKMLNAKYSILFKII